MGKRKRKSSKKFRQRYPRQINKFYHAFDKNGGHPSLVYFADSKNDIYYVQRFSTKKRKGREKLSHSINPQSNNDEWLIRKPSVIGFDDMVYKKEYEIYRIHEDDIEIVQKYRRYNLKKKIKK